MSLHGTFYIPRRHLAVVGPTGEGKTVALRRWSSTVTRIVYTAPVADPASFPTDGCVLVNENEQADAAELLAGAVLEKQPLCLVVEASADDYQGDVDAWARTVLTVGDTVLIVDEFEEAVAGGVTDGVTTLLWRGRKVSAWLWGAAHRPLGIPRVLTSSGDVAALRTTEPRDIQWYDEAGMPGDRIAALPRFHMIVKAEGRILELDSQGRVIDSVTPQG